MPQIDSVLHGFTLTSDQGAIGFSAVTLVRGQHNILVDVAHVGRRRVLIDGLARLGLNPSDIDVVFLTHGHWDHILNMDLFPQAEFLIHPVEREYVHHPHENDWATPGYTSLLLESYRLTEVREGDEIERGIAILETPGHSPGSMSLLVQANGATAAITGDALSSAWSAISGEPRLVFHDLEAGRRSIARIRERAGVIYPGHDRPFRIAGGAVEYLESSLLQVSGLPDAGVGEGDSAVTYTFAETRAPITSLAQQEE